MLDQIFGQNQFQTEIIWRRTNAKGLAFRSFPNDHDTVFYFTKSDDYTFNRQYLPHDEKYIQDFYKYVDPETGRQYQLADLTNPNKDRPNLTYEFLGIKRVWRWTKERMQEAYEKGLIVQSSPDSVPRLKRFLDEQEGMPIDSIWADIPPIQSQSEERLGYPTQKPLALLDRIIKASSNPNDIVLDAFCGCGTALVAAENLGRQWIGIDVSPTACRVMAKRLRDVCKMKEDEKLWKIGRGFVVRDLPWTIEKLREIPPFEFENWAVIALGGIPNVAKVGDMGIDGRIYPVSATPKKKEGELEFMDAWYPIQVKQKDKVGRPDIDSFEAAMMREDRTKGFFVAFDYSSDAMSEIQAFFKKTGKSIIALTVKDILDELIAYKLA
jgi:site-specific DNA-methyltransferase (adenine-specific)